MKEEEANEAPKPQTLLLVNDMESFMDKISASGEAKETLTLDKHVFLVIISITITVIIQGIAGIWWGASINEKVESIEQELDARVTSRFTLNDAKMEFALRDQKISQIDDNMKEIVFKLDALSAKITELTIAINKRRL